MAPARLDLRKSFAGYLDKTHRPLNCLVFVLPLLAAYEAGAALFGDQLRASRDMYALLRLFGATGPLWPAVVVILVLLAWHVYTRQRWHVDGEALVGMVAESVLWVVPLVLMYSALAQVMSDGSLAAQTGEHQRAIDVLTGVGAGVYEEFLFRLAGLGVFMLVCVKWVKAPRRPMIVAGAIVTAILFSLYHFIGEEFNGLQFVFYVAAGGYLAVMYVVRGFGVAVGVHACYNVLVAVWQWG